MAIGTAAMSPHRPSEGDPRQAQAQVLGDDDWMLLAVVAPDLQRHVVFCSESGLARGVVVRAGA
jgi:hypothetical protein